MRLGFAVFFLTLAAPAFATDLVGPESCRTCHAEAYRIWAQGPHARAVASFSAEQHKSSLCLSCHSRDEQRSTASDPIAGVSCETCHGGGRYYQAAVVMRDKELARLFGLQDAAATCSSCHGPGSPSAQPFDVKAALQRIDHWTAERARRQAGAQAGVPRTRLAGRLREGR
jgi:cytochrome c554/c'-like protein